MSTRSALVIGGSGLVGRQLLQNLLESDKYSQIRVLSRTDLGFKHAKLEVIIFDFDFPKLELVIGEDVYCCLGTTMKKAGSKANFYKVDFTYPTQIAAAALKNGSKRFSIVTAMGADAKSSFYYNRVKGEVEAALENMKFESLFIFRPSLLLGVRPDSRLGEQIGEKFARIFRPFIPVKYRAIEASKVAKAMLSITTSKIKGSVVYESEVLQEF